MPTLPLTAWSAESLRLTVFPAIQSTLRSPDWWKLVVGEDPSETTTNPKRGLVSAEGNFHHGKLVFRSMLDRMAWFFVPQDASAEELLMKAEHPTIGPAIESIEEFSEGMERWLVANDLPELARIAFGGVLVLPMEDRKEAYIQLRDYIPVRIDPDSTDILYQINVPGMESNAIQGLRFNRLSKWFVGNYSVIGIPMVQSMAVPVMQNESGLAIRVELDINTIPWFQGIILKDHMINVFRELVAIARTVVTEGVGSVEQ